MSRPFAVYRYPFTVRYPLSVIRGERIKDNVFVNGKWLMVNAFGGTSKC